MGIYRWQIVPVNVEKNSKICKSLVIGLFSKEISKSFDNVDNNKAPGSVYTISWALKSKKCAIGTHFQIVFNDSIQMKIFPASLKDARTHTNFQKKEIAKNFERLLLK